MTTQGTADTVGVGRGAPSFGLSWPLLVMALAFLGNLTPRLLNDPDTYWHLATANWMFEHAGIPSTDPFSHTVPGAPWQAHEWLSEVLLGVAYRLAGWAGPVMLAAAAFATSLALICRHLLRHMEPIHALGITALAALLLEGHLLARPHVLAFPLIAAWGIALVQAREAGRAPAWPWALVMAAWANLHGSFPLGIGLAAFFAIEATWTSQAGERRQAAWAWGRFVMLALLAAFVTPHGVNGLIYAVDVNRMTFSLDNISEWKSPDFHEFQPLEVALMAGALAVLLRGLRLPLMHAVLVLGFLHLALVHQRHADFLALLVPVAVAELVGRQWGRQAGTGPAAVLDRWFHSLAAPARPLGMAAVGALLLGAACLVARSGTFEPPSETTPDAAVQAALGAGPGGQVMNSYQFGGYLIFSGIAPAIDGRADVYGDAFVADYIDAIKLKAPERFIKLLEQQHIGWTLFSPNTPAVVLLDYLPGWRRIYSDKTAVVHVRSRQD